MFKSTQQIQQDYQSAIASYQNSAVPVSPSATPLMPVQALVRQSLPAPRVFIPSYNNSLNRVLDDTTIMRLAPSVFAREAWQETSEHYRFLPTISVVNALRDDGYSVVKAQQSRSRIEGKGDFTKHILRLRHRDFMNVANVGEEVPEIVLVNSHDRTSAYKIMLGIFRLACSNGMMVESEKIDSLSIRHTGNRNLLDSVIDVTAEVVRETPKVMEQIHRFKSLMLSNDEQRAFAVSALELSDSTIKIDPSRLLSIRRYADKGQADGTNSIWKTSNIIQENLIRGGVRGINSKGRFMRTRELKCVAKDININKALWKLTEELAKIKG